MPNEPINVTSPVRGTLENETSRQYAADARSKTLPDWVDQILAEAARGEEVDVWLFSKALTQAMSSAATRHAVSTERRVLTRKVRHLSYWAQAKIEQALLDLPVIEPGARSPRIAELEAEVEAERGHFEEAMRRMGEVTEVLETERRTSAAWHRLANRKAAALEYAISLLGVTERARVEGYHDRLLEEEQA